MMQKMAAGFGAVVFGLGALGAGLPAFAGPVVDKATSIETRMAAGDAGGAIVEAREILAALWAESPAIGFTDNLLVIEPASGFGIYNPRPDNIFHPGEAVVLYAEPFGFGYGSPGEGLYSIGFMVDLQVLDEAGKVLGDVPNVTQLDMSSRFPNTEFQANITYNLDGIPVGKYRLVTTLRDKNSDKFGTFDTDIVIAE